MGADGAGEGFGRETDGGEIGAGGGGHGLADLAGGLDAGDHGQARQARLALGAAVGEPPADIVADPVQPGLDPPMLEVVRFV